MHLRFLNLSEGRIEWKYTWSVAVIKTAGNLKIYCDRKKKGMFRNMSKKKVFSVSIL